MAVSFDLALRDPRVVRARVIRRGGSPTACRWPTFWMEGSVYEYVIGRDPFPPVGTPRRRLILVGEERQVFAPAQAAKLSTRIRSAWASDLESVAALDGAALARLLHQDEHAFGLCMLVLVHRWPAGSPRPRPSLEDSWRRHEQLIAELARPARAKGLPIAWHAVWRLPPAMTWNAPGEHGWMRYPAVSFAAAVQSLQAEACAPGIENPGGVPNTSAAGAGHHEAIP